MTLIDSLMSRAGYVRQNAMQSRLDALDAEIKAGRSGIDAPGFLLASAGMERWSIDGDWARKVHYGNLYSNSSWLQTAISIVSQMGAGQEVEVVSRQGEDESEIENHPFEMLMDKPNPLMGRHDFIEATLSDRQLAGNAYWWINAPSPDAPPTELWIIPPENLKPVPDGRLYLAGYEYQDGSYKTVIPVDQVVHFKRYNPRDRFVGLSAVQALATSVVGDLAMQSWNTNYFAKNNAKPAGGLFFENFVNNADWEKFNAELKQDHGGTLRNMLTARGVPKGGTYWMQFGLSQKDMEFISGRTFAKEEIYNAVAPGLASVLAVNATEANAVAGEATLTAKAVWPILVNMSDTITAQLLSRYGKNLRAHFEDPRRQDKALELQTRQVQMKYMTIMELRAEDGLEPIGDERDKLLVDQVPKGTGSVEPPAPAPVMMQQDTEATPPEQKPVEEPAPGDESPKPEDTIQPAKAAPSFTADLRLWRKKALRMFAVKGTGVCGFASDGIPPTVRNRVAYGLAGAGDTGAIKALFDGEIQAVEGVRTAEIVELASALRLAAAAGVGA